MSASGAASSESFQTLYRHHHGWLYGWLRHKLGSDVEAADIAHDTFLRLMVASVPDAIKEPRAFLTTIANGLVINHWKKRDIERAYLDALAAFPPSSAPSSEQLAIVVDTLCQIDNMLSSLNDKARRAFLLAQLEGLTYQQIATELGVSERMVKKYMADAMFQCLLILGEDI